MDWLSRQLINHQAELAEEHELLEKLILNLDGGVAFVNRDMVYQLVNPEFAKLFDRKPSDFIGRKIFSLLPDTATQLKAILEQVVKTNRPFAATKLPLTYHDHGKLRTTYWNGTVTPITDNFGHHAGVLILCFNVTDSVALEEERNLKAAIVEGSFDAIITVDLKGRILSWNASAERAYGYTRAEALGRNMSITVPKDKAAEAHDALQKIARGEEVEFYVTERIRKSGDRFPVCIAVSPVRSSDGSVIGASGVVRDLSEKLEQLAPHVVASFHQGR